MDNFKIAITDCDHSNIDMERSVFEKAGFSFDFYQCKTEQDLIDNCKGVNAFINQYAPITDTVMNQLPDLKLVVRYGVGVNNVDLDAATKHGVQICNVPDYGMNEVADHAMAMTLMLTRKLYLMDSLTKNGVWDYSKSIPIFRHGVSTVGVIGIGRIGREYAKRANAFGCKVIACDDYAKDIPDFIQMVSFDELITQSDIISVHCPLDNNVDLIGEEEFKKMKKTAYIINVSRGGIINEEALHKALAEKEIAGAALDVLTKEPMPMDSPLKQHQNLILTPHMAWYSEEAALELKRKVAEETIRFAKGEPVHYPVNKI